MGGDELLQGDIQSLNGLEETIRVSIRLRPLNEKELVKNDLSDWECINNNAIIFRSSLPERSMFPQSYAFGKKINNVTMIFNTCFEFLRSDFLFCDSPDCPNGG